MKSQFGRVIFMTVFLCAFAYLPAIAQDLDNVTISGKISDSNNAPIVGATVTAKRIESDTERTVTTNEDGFYRIVELEPGTYSVKFSASGFGAKEQVGLVTIAGQNVQLNISLEPAGVTAEQTITIDGDDAPAVDTTRTVVGGTVQQREIEELPNSSRDPLSLIFTLGGVAEEPFSQRDLAQDKGGFNQNPSSAYNTPEEAGVFSLSGGAAYSNNITIDGLDNNDDRGASVRFSPSLDAVAEVQVITNQFSAEYGRASGGRVNFRTRSGGKTLRGRVSYFFEDESLNANTWRNNSFGIARPSRQSHIPVFSLGGPLAFPNFGEGVPFFRKNNKTFFFVAYEYQNVREDALINTYVPITQNSRFPLPSPTNTSNTVGTGATALAQYTELVPTPFNNHIFSARIDHKFTDKHSINSNFQYGQREDFRQFSGRTRLAEALLGNSQMTKAISLTDDYVFSANAVNQARFQYSTLTPRAVGNSGLLDPVVLITLPSGLNIDGANIGTLIAGSSTTNSTDRKEERFQFQDSLTVVAGSHILRFGGDVQRVKSTFTDRGDATGTYSFATVADFLNNNVTRYRQNFGAVSRIQNTYYGAFAQDDWRIRPNFTLSLGVRYERETILDDNNNFGPRMAIAWSPFKDNKGVIRFGAGIFYNRALLRIIEDNTVNFVTDAVVFDSGTRGTSGALPEAVFQSISTGFPNPLSETQVRSLCTTYNLRCTASSNFTQTLASDIKLPESYQFNLGFEREIGKGFVFEANATYNKTVHLWRRVAYNAIDLGILNQKTGGNFASVTDYLISQSFNNTSVNGVRPIYNTNGARDRVIFATSFTAPTSGPTRCTGTIAPSNAAQGGCIVINGVPTTVLNLNGTIATGSNPTSPQVVAAKNALAQFRPFPTLNAGTTASLDDFKEIRSIGNSEYKGLILELRRRYRQLGYGFGSSFRFAYTLSRSMDDGIVNTSQAQIAGDFSSEWARSLTDRTHRIAISGVVDSPNWLGRLRFSPIFKYGSSAPFNLSNGNFDRNIDGNGNDRPNYTGDINDLVYRNPGEPFPQAVFDALTLATIGTPGNLPRNAGRGPAYYMFDLNVSREFKFNERFKFRPNIEINNVLNARVFSFGGAFINANDAQNSFLVPQRTYRPREIRLGLRFDF